MLTHTSRFVSFRLVSPRRLFPRFSYSEWPKDVNARLLRKHGIHRKGLPEYTLLVGQEMIRRIQHEFNPHDFDPLESSGQQPDNTRRRRSIVAALWRETATKSIAVSKEVHSVLKALLIMVGYTDEVVNLHLNRKEGLDWEAITAVVEDKVFYQGLDRLWLPKHLTRDQLLPALQCLAGVEYRISKVNKICSAVHGTMAIKALAYILTAAEAVGCHTSEIFTEWGTIKPPAVDSPHYWGEDRKDKHANLCPFPMQNTVPVPHDAAGDSHNIRCVVRWSQQCAYPTEVGASLIIMDWVGEVRDVVYDFKPKTFGQSARMLTQNEVISLMVLGESQRRQANQQPSAEDFLVAEKGTAGDTATSTVNEGSAIARNAASGPDAAVAVAVGVHDPDFGPLHAAVEHADAQKSLASWPPQQFSSDDDKDEDEEYEEKKANMKRAADDARLTNLSAGDSSISVGSVYNRTVDVQTDTPPSPSPLLSPTPAHTVSGEVLQLLKGATNSKLIVPTSSPPPPATAPVPPPPRKFSISTKMATSHSSVVPISTPEASQPALSGSATPAQVPLATPPILAPIQQPPLTLSAPDTDEKPVVKPPTIIRLPASPLPHSSRQSLGAPTSKPNAALNNSDPAAAAAHSVGAASSTKPPLVIAAMSAAASGATAARAHCLSAEEGALPAAADQQQIGGLSAEERIVSAMRAEHARARYTNENLDTCIDNVWPWEDAFKNREPTLKPPKPEHVWNSTGFEFCLDAAEDEIAAFGIVLNAPLKQETLGATLQARVQFFTEDSTLLGDTSLDMTAMNESECLLGFVWRSPIDRNKAERLYGEEVVTQQRHAADGGGKGMQHKQMFGEDDSGGGTNSNGVAGDSSEDGVDVQATGLQTEVLMPSFKPSSVGMKSSVRVSVDDHQDPNHLHERHRKMRSLDKPAYDVIPPIDVVTITNAVNVHTAAPLNLVNRDSVPAGAVMEAAAKGISPTVPQFGNMLAAYKERMQKGVNKTMPLAEFRNKAFAAAARQASETSPEDVHIGYTDGGNEIGYTLFQQIKRNVAVTTLAETSQYRTAWELRSACEAVARREEPLNSGKHHFLRATNLCREHLAREGLLIEPPGAAKHAATVVKSKARSKVRRIKKRKSTRKARKHNASSIIPVDSETGLPVGLPPVLRRPLVMEAAESSCSSSDDDDNDDDSDEERGGSEDHLDPTVKPATGKRTGKNPATPSNPAVNGDRTHGIIHKPEKKSIELNHGAWNGPNIDEGRKTFNPFQMITGDLLPVPESVWSSDLRIGLGWDIHVNLDGRKPKRIDLDCSVVAYAGREKFGQVDFGNATLKGGGVSHMGDCRRGGSKGDDETIMMNLNNLDPSITQLFIFVTLFQGGTFHDLDDIHVRLLMPVDSYTNDSIQEKEVCRHDSHTLQGVPESHRTILVAHIKTGWQHGWSFHGVHCSSKGSTDKDLHAMAVPNLVSTGTLLWAKSKWRKLFLAAKKLRASRKSRKVRRSSSSSSITTGDRAPSPRSSVAGLDQEGGGPAGRSQEATAEVLQAPLPVKIGQGEIKGKRMVKARRKPDDELHLSATPVMKDSTHEAV